MSILYASFEGEKSFPWKTKQNRIGAWSSLLISSEDPSSKHGNTSDRILWWWVFGISSSENLGGIILFMWSFFACKEGWVSLVPFVFIGSYCCAYHLVSMHSCSVELGQTTSWVLLQERKSDHKKKRRRRSSSLSSDRSLLCSPVPMIAQVRGKLGCYWRTSLHHHRRSRHFLHISLRRCQTHNCIKNIKSSPKMISKPKCQNSSQRNWVNFTHTQNSQNLSISLSLSLSLCKEKFSGELHTHPKLSLSLSARRNSLVSFTHTQNSPYLSLSLSLSLSRCAREKFSDELHTYPKLPMPLSLAARKILYNVDKNIQSAEKLESIDIAKHSRCKSHKPI